MAEKKMTKVQRFEEILGIDALTDEQREFLTKEIELLKKKNSHISKADKAKAELNEKVRETALEIINSGDVIYTATELANALSKELDVAITSQRVAPIVNKLVDEGLLGVDVVKGRKYYKRVA